jgi:hypothetical protein
MRTVDPWEIAKTNPGILIGGISTLFIAIRILSVAHFDPETASEILQSGGAGSIILGTILSVMGTVLAGSLLIFLLSLMPRIVVAQSTKMSERPSDTSQDSERSFNEGFRTFLVVLVAAAVLALVPVTLIIIVVVIALFVLVSNIRAVRTLDKLASSDLHESSNGQEDQSANKGQTDPPPPPKPTAGTRPTSAPASLPSSNLSAVANSLLFVAAAYIVILAVTAPPWFPLEKLSIKNSQPVTAYVVSDSNGEMVVMLPRTRQIRYLDRSTIAGRASCEVNQSVFLKTLPQLLNSDNSKYIQCSV